LKEIDCVEGRNLAIEYRWAVSQNDRLPSLAADLVRRKLAVIIAGDTPSALALKAGDLDYSDRFLNSGRPNRKHVFRT
jgi:putative ABC transport system substrate-binding protein